MQLKDADYEFYAATSTDLDGVTGKYMVSNRISKVGTQSDIYNSAWWACFALSRVPAPAVDRSLQRCLTTRASRKSFGGCGRSRQGLCSPFECAFDSSWWPPLEIGAPVLGIASWWQQGMECHHSMVRSVAYEWTSFADSILPEFFRNFLKY